MADVERRLNFLEHTYAQLSGSASLEHMDTTSESSDDESSDSDVARQIARSMASLTLDEGSLILHNHLSPFRLKRPSAAPLPSRIPQSDPRKRYCLQLSEGETEGHTGGRELPYYFNPSFEFNRYLPKDLPGGAVLTRREHDRCLSLVFKFVTPWGEGINEQMFLEDMWEALNPERPRPDPNGPPPQLPHYSPMLHNAIVAVALSFSDDPQFKDLATRDCFANKAVSYLNAECQKPCISTILGLNLIGTYHSVNGNSSLGFLYLGMSTRIGQALGLNVDCSSLVKSGVITEEHRRDRIWAWWTVFCQEVCCSSFFGRDVGIPSLPPPLQVPYPSVEPEFDKLSWYHSPAHIPSQNNDISATFAATCALMMITRTVMDTVGNLAAFSRQIVDHSLNQLDADLQGWEDGLDPALVIDEQNAKFATSHKLMLHTAKCWTSILLHRPFFLRRRKLNPPAHATICQIAAEKIMEYTAIRRHLFSLRYVPVSFCQMIFAAATIFLLLAIQSASGGEQDHDRVKEHLEQADLVVEYLKETGESFECANKLADILQDVIDERVKPCIRSRMGERSPGDNQRVNDPQVPGDNNDFGGRDPHYWTNGFPMALQPAPPFNQLAPMFVQEIQHSYSQFPGFSGSSASPAGYNYIGTMNEQTMPLFFPEAMGMSNITGLPTPTQMGMGMETNLDWWPFGMS